jgi:hypothetical protein
LQADDQLRLQPFMQPDETILWTGHPDASRLLSSKDLVLIPFSLLWGGFALFWEGLVLSTGVNDVVFPLFGIPFVVAGQYFIWGRFVYKRWDRGRTLYGLTNQRILILRGRSLQSLFVKEIPGINQLARADGSGSLEFGNLPPAYAFWADTGADFLTQARGAPAFYDIPDVAQVYRLVSEARAARG